MLLIMLCSPRVRVRGGGGGGRLIVIVRSHTIAVTVHNCLLSGHISNCSLTLVDYFESPARWANQQGSPHAYLRTLKDTSR